MAQLLNIKEPATTTKAGKPSLAVVLALGFRPIYMLGAFWALVSIALWIFAPQLIGKPLSLVAWHAHEMLWGFIITIAIGFLLTASATWTGINPLHGKPLGLLAVLWIIARIGFLFGGITGFWIATTAELIFFAIAAIALARVVIKGNSKRNYGLPILIFMLGLADLLYLLGVLDGNYLVLMERFDIGLVGMAVIALLIARRVIPFFSKRMVPGLDIPMLTKSGHWQMILGPVAIVALVANQCLLANGASKVMALDIIAAICLAVTGVISLVQLWYWNPKAVLHKAMLWILYLGYAFIGIGLVFAAIQLSQVFDPALMRGMLARSATHVHLIGMAGFCILIIGMLTRTALGHLGRPLALDGSMLASYWFMIAAVVFRLAALWPSTASQHLLHLAALAWIICMALYLWRFVPMLIRPRPDKPAPVAQPKVVKKPAAQTN